MTGREEGVPALQNIPLRSEEGRALREKYRKHSKPLCVNYSELERLMEGFVRGPTPENEE